MDARKAGIIYLRTSNEELHGHAAARAGRSRAPSPRERPDAGPHHHFAFYVGNAPGRFYYACVRCTRPPTPDSIRPRAARPFLEQDAFARAHGTSRAPTRSPITTHSTDGVHKIALSVPSGGRTTTRAPRQVRACRDGGGRARRVHALLDRPTRHVAPLVSARARGRVPARLREARRPPPTRLVLSGCRPHRGQRRDRPHADW